MLLRHIKLGLVALTALVGATSCLDKYPDSAIPEKDAMQTFADAEQHLIGIYGHLMNSALYSGYLTLLPDIQCDLAYAVEGNSNTYGDFWLWKIRPTDLLIQDVYAQLYAVIGACNFYLDRIDAVMAGNRQSAQILIVSPKYDQIAERIFSEMHRGVTLLDGEGWYTKTPTKVVMVVCRKNETGILFRVIKEVDPHAFMTFGSVMGVYGLGFEALKK